ncbi:MAG: FAD-dependent oxidoreductase, partial [Burkholderiaceae bacterium]
MEVRVSEFLSLKLEGHPIGALAMIARDNPLLAATGHRICNDCSRACVFQQQTPVDIPAAESRVLEDVIGLPWGFEIYSLLTRWNPLNLRRPFPAPPSGATALVVGMGPAGFTLAHHLLNEGHAVVAVDGLKIEPLPVEAGLAGRQEPIRDIRACFEPLGARIAGGFGGVAEYGITARWDKNLLTVIRLLLERRSLFRLYGGVRFGGTFGFERAWELGFDHVALAMGAGRPNLVDVPGALAPGVRMASDFLMALQLTGAARADSLANLQIRMPVVVIGGGLTAVDAATEALAYYVAQVERFADRHEAMRRSSGEDQARAPWSEVEAEQAGEFLMHAQAIRDERAAASREARPARLQALLDAWGGATIVYRRGLTESPAYRRNHEELQHALAEGVRFVDELAPVAVLADAKGQTRAVRFARRDDAERVELPARTVLVAAGTHPNT